jgi:electron transport complex protein RnfG
MKKDYIAPILALSLICLVISGALALANNITYPIIEEAAAKRTAEAMNALIPGAGDFIRIENPENTNLPPAIREAYRTEDEACYIFIVNTRGFGGDMQIMVALSHPDNFHGSTVLSHSETINFAVRVFAISDDLEAQGLSLLDIDTISGATVTFTAYQRALEAALEAFEMLGGGISE